MIRPHRFPWLLLALSAGTAPIIAAVQAAPVAATPPASPATSHAPAGKVNAAEARLVREVAAATGKSAASLRALLDGAKVQSGILAAIARPAERKPWREYRPIFLTPERIAEGVSYYRRHRALLDQIGQRYGVPPQFIVAIIGVETNYGANVGHYRILDALVTLAFHYPPRAHYFRRELKTLLELPASKLPGPIPDIRGSYAGAEGLAQFMPSSIRDFAVDADGDGHIDLAASLPDAFASIANYFRAKGWQSGQPVAIEADPGPDAAAAPAWTDAPPRTPLAQLRAAGYMPIANADPALPANLLTLDAADGPEYWLTFQNFYVITRYNHSAMYAMAVTQLADAIAHGVAAAPAAR